MVSVNNLKYKYHDAVEETLHGLTFEISKQEIFGFLGPSGAGKSTTQKIIIGLLKEYSGNIKLMDREIKEWGQELYENIGVSFELPNHYLKLTAIENLNYFKSLYSVKTLDPMDVLDWVGLKDNANQKVSTFSKGMKMRLNVARSLLNNPKMLFLDEPTNGLDPVNAKKIRDLIRKLRNDGATIFVTTHNMTLADELCDRVAFITSGNINVIDAPKELKKQYGNRILKVEYKDNGTLKYKDFSLNELGNNYEFIEFIKSGKHIETMHSQETTLDNIFIKVTGEEIKE